MQDRISRHVLSLATQARFLRAENIWLAIDDSYTECRRFPTFADNATAWLNSAECEGYHRQQFFWLLNHR